MDISFLKNGRTYLWYGLLLLVFSIPLSQFISVKILLLLAIASCFFKGDQFFKISLFSFDTILYLIVLLGGLIYSDDVTTGIKTLETNFSFLAFLIILSRFEDLAEKRKPLFNAFVIGLILASFICLVNALIQYWQTGSLNSFFFYDLTNSSIGLQPTYFAYYLIFGITFCLYQFSNEDGDDKSIAQIIIALFFFAMLLLTGGQTTYVSILLVFSFFILKFLVGEKKQSEKITLAMTIAMVACLFFSTWAGVNNTEPILSDSWERFVLWESALKANLNPILGVGTGDYKLIMNEYYQAHDLKIFARDSYNSHNQFIQILLTNGILGLLSVILLIGRQLYLSAKYNDVLGILIFFPFLIYGMTEVFLGRSQGVVFFALLHQVNTSSYFSVKQKNQEIFSVK